MSDEARTARENAAWVVEQEDLAHELAKPGRRALNAFWRALMLARDLETFEALLDGESVPLDRLDPEWVERFGRRKG